MRFPSLLLGCCWLAAALPDAARAGAPAQLSFQILDETDPQEISEDTAVFIDGHQVAHFILDAKHQSITADVIVPAADHYDYAVCGRITVRRPDGKPEQKVVDGGGRLKQVNGHLFRALAGHDFTIFYLSDSLEDPIQIPPDTHHTDACSLPVS